MFNTYEQAYAYYCNRYAAYYSTQSLQRCKQVRADIYDTMEALYPAISMRTAGSTQPRPPYMGKLMAELDAVRTRIDALRPAQAPHPQTLESMRRGEGV